MSLEVAAVCDRYAVIASDGLAWQKGGPITGQHSRKQIRLGDIVVAAVFILTFYLAVNFPANLSGSYGSAGTNPAATYIVYKDTGSGPVLVETIQISTGGVFTFATSGGTVVSFAAGDRMTATAPSPQDATLQDIAMTFAGRRG